MKQREQWKDGPGKMEFGDTVQLKAVKKRAGQPGMNREHTHIAFTVFGNHTEVYWNLEDNEFNFNTPRHLGDKQKRYLKFLTMLISYTNFKSLRPEL